MEKSKKLSLGNRHVIKQHMAQMKPSSGIIRTKAGKRLSEELRKARSSFRTMHGLGEEDIKKAVERNDWKMAIWLAIENTVERDISKEVGKILFEIYKRECNAETSEKREEQWTVFLRDIFNGVFDFYKNEEEIPEGAADLIIEASNIARKEIGKLEVQRLHLENQ